MFDCDPNHIDHAAVMVASLGPLVWDGPEKADYFPFLQVRFDYVLEYQCLDPACEIRKNRFGALCEKCGFKVYSTYPVKSV